ncbi:MAG: sulfurtransferase TusA family protein [Fidelibacterota bacterium]
MSEYQVDHYLDCKGLNCPLPVLKTKKTIDNMNSSEILKMVATDPGSVNDIRAFTSRTGHELLDEVVKDEEYIFYIRKA